MRTPQDKKALLLGIAAAAAVLWVPYFVPQKAVASDAYLFGFNNRVAVLLLVALSAVIAVWKDGCGLELKAAGMPSRISGRVLSGCLALQLLACAAMVKLLGGLGGFGESAYEIDRIWLLAHGKVPYVGFEWPFGVLFLYGPLWISRGLQCSLANAYYAFWIAASLVGTGLLYAVINRLDLPTLRKSGIFLLAFFGFLPSVIGMGTHYTGLRFITPLYFILVVHGLSAGVRRRGLAAVLAVGFTALLLLISPEMAIAHCFACCVLLFPKRTGLSPGALPAGSYGGMVLAFAIVFAAAYRLHLLETLLASGGGADSFPLPLSAVALFFFGVVLVGACSLVRRWRDAALNDNSIALIVIAVPLLAAGLGRCDPGHMYSNGIGLFLAGLLYASQSERTWRLGRNGFLVVWLLLGSYVQGGLLLPVLMHTAEVGREHAAPAVIDFATVYPGLDLARTDGVFETPVGYKPNGWGTYLSSAVDYGYYEGFENANTTGAVQRKIGELADHPNRDLLLPRDVEARCRFDERAERNLLTVLFLFPYMAPAVHTEDVHGELCGYVASHYLVAYPATAENYGYSVWIPRDAVGGK